MKPTRRGFFAMLAAAPAAAKELVPEVLKGGRDYDVVSAGHASPSTLGYYAGEVKQKREDWLAEIRKSLANLTDRISPFSTFREGVQRFDPDIASNRSLSLAAKVNIQARRNYDAALAREKSWLEEQLARALSSKE